MKLLFNCPLSPQKANTLIDVLGLGHDAHVLDVGCGTGEFLARLVEASGATALGIDRCERSVRAARGIAQARNLERLTFQVTRAEDFAPDERFDAGLCVAATHAFSLGAAAYPQALAGLMQFVKPGGLLLLGESYWIQPPAQEYRDFVGEPIGTYRTHLENVELATDLGLLPVYAVTSSDDEWDEFEWRHSMSKEREADEFEAQADTEAAERIRAQSRAWRMAYLRWGRGTLGFGYYVFRIPTAA